MQVHVIGPNLPDQSTGQFHVHRADCSDIARRYPRGLIGQRGARWIVEVDSEQAIIEEIYSDVMGDYDPPAAWEDYAGEVHIYPCVEVPTYSREVAIPLDVV